MQRDWNLGIGDQQGAAGIIELLVFNLSLFPSHGDRDIGNTETQARVTIKEGRRHYWNIWNNDKKVTDLTWETTLYSTPCDISSMFRD